MVLSPEEFREIRNKYGHFSTIPDEDLERMKQAFSPGMRVRNVLSGNTAIVRGNRKNPTQLDDSSLSYIPIRRTVVGGRQPGRVKIDDWHITSVEIL